MRKFEIQWSDKRCKIIFKGKISIDDVNHANKIINGDRRYYAVKSSFWDFVEADMSEISPDQLYTIVALDLGAQRVMNEQKVAMLVKGSYEKDLCEHYVCQMQNHGSGWDLKVFTNETDAHAWLSH